MPSEINHQPSPRLSVPVSNVAVNFGSELWTAHSFDLTVFPLVLAREVAPRVKIRMQLRFDADSKLRGLFKSSDGTVRWLCYAALDADEAGILTDSDELYHSVHAAFREHSDDSSYIGFAHAGIPPFSPLFVLGIMYSQYGRGIFPNGELRPQPMRNDFTFTWQVR